MSDILSFLKDLLPVWAVLLLGGFGYLIVLIRRASERFLDITEKQADYLKDRVDVVDKSTGIFTRTIEQQEKEIRRLTDQVSKLGAELKNARETDARLSVDELRFFARSIEALQESQRDLAQRLEPGSAPIDNTKVLTAAIASELPRAIRARDLSIYSVLLNQLGGADALLEDLRRSGYAASVDKDEVRIVDAPGQFEAIRLGSAVPTDAAKDVIAIARSHWPFLKYVHLSADSDGPDDTHTTIYLGGSSSSATGFLQCAEWTERDFKDLRQENSLGSLHKYVRARYSPDNPKRVAG